MNTEQGKNLCRASGAVSFAIPTHGFAVGYLLVAPTGARSVEEGADLYLRG